MKKYLFILFAVIPFLSNSQTFFGVGGPIPDDGNSIMFPITVSGLPTSIDSNFGCVTVCLNATHTWDDDLTCYLIAPDGSAVELFSHIGGDADSFSNTCLNMAAAQLITDTWAPYTGTFIPEGNIGDVNNGQDPNGDWNLFFIDTYPFADAGYLFDWDITFGANAASPDTFPFTHSMIPIVIIDTDFPMIPDEPKIDATLSVIDNGPGQINYLNDLHVLDVDIGIESRGQSSEGFPKKNYGLETRDINGDDLAVQILGMPAESDWVMLASYSDKTLMRPAIAFDLYRKMGWYAPRIKYCDVVLNGDYIGTYMFTEKVKVDINRINIAKLTPLDNAGDEVTGGYILKVDWWDGDGIHSQYNAVNGGPLYYAHQDPAWDEITQPQHDYITSFIDTVEDVFADSNYNDTVTGYRKYVSVASFVDMAIILELSKNVDGYRLSSFCYKDKNSNSNQLFCGPPWDYDLSFGNADYMEGWQTTDWNYLIQENNTGQMPFYWHKMFDDSLFQTRMKCRWDELRQTILDQDTLFAFIDSVAAYIDSSQQINFQRWPILGTYVWPNPSPIPATYTEEIQKMKDFITDRLIWIDNNLPGYCPPPDTIIDTTTIADLLIQQMNVRVFPNPFDDLLKVTVSLNQSDDVRLELLNALGESVAIAATESFAPGKNDLTISFEDYELPSGIYFLKISTISSSSQIMLTRK